MTNFRSIKDLVIYACSSEGRFPSYEKLTASVREHFPTSKWQKTHYAWYKSQIKRGEILVPGVSQEGGDDSSTNDLEETVEASLSLERDLHSFLAMEPNLVEAGLSLMDGGIEYATEAGRIDLLCSSDSGDCVVVELKAGKAKDAVIGQILGYMSCVQERFAGTTVRGIIVASDFEQRVVFAAKRIPDLKLVRYRMSFDFNEIT